MLWRSRMPPDSGCWMTMQILAVTNMYPTPANPALGTFIEQQVESLRTVGLDVDVLILERAIQGRRVYLYLTERLSQKTHTVRYDLVHIMYCGIMAEFATKAVQNIPTVVTIHGSDLFGNQLARPVERLSAYLGIVASRRAARRADGVITVSSRLRDALPKDIDRSKVRVIPCGIDLQRFRPQDPAQCRKVLGWHSNALHILFATNGNPIKRPLLASKAVEVLQQLGT